MTASGDVITGAAFDRADNPNCCIALRSATQSIATGGTGVLISFDAEEFDNSTMFTPTSTNVTIQSAGVYIVAIDGTWQFNTAGYRALEILVNGFSATAVTDMPITGTAVTRHGVSNAFLLTALDVITVNAFQSSGSSLTLTARCSVTRITG